MLLKQVQGIMGGRFNYRGSWHVLQSLVAEGGALGLFRGYWVRHRLVSFSCLDGCVQQCL